jgi:hypothetical protein
MSGLRQARWLTRDRKPLMSEDKLRQQIVFEAARLMFQRQELEYGRARVRAAKLVCRQRLRPSELPTNREIREELERLSSSYTMPPTPDAPDTAVGAEWESDERFARYRRLLLPLSRIQPDRRRHPEADVLYHSLQVFNLACEELAYDEEFLAAALLHDVGQAIDPMNSVAAGLEALGESISERTAWLIENLSLAHTFLEGTIGVRARRRLQNSESGDELMLLAKCDAAGRVPGAIVPELDEALAYLRDLSDTNE